MQATANPPFPLFRSVWTWIEKDRKNGAKAMDPGNHKSFDKLYTKDKEPVDVRAPGIFMVPVCMAVEAKENWKKGKKGDNPYYPCNKL